MFQFPNAASGLKKIFIGQMLAIAGTLLMFVPLINIVGLFAVLASVIMNFIGIMDAAKDDAGYRKALSYTIIQFLLSLLQFFLVENSIVYRLVDLADSIFGLMVLYHICHTTAKLLRFQHANDIAAEGRRVWDINIKCIAAAVLCTLICFIPLVNIIAALALIVIAIVTIYAAVLYIIFIYHSYRRLEVPFYTDQPYSY